MNKKHTKLLPISFAACLLILLNYTNDLETLKFLSDVPGELFKNLNWLELFNPAFIERIEYLYVTSDECVRASVYMYVCGFEMTFFWNYLTSENNRWMDM